MNDEIKNRLDANELAWIILVEFLMEKGLIDKSDLIERFESNCWLDCKADLQNYIFQLQRMK